MTIDIEKLKRMLAVKAEEQPIETAFDATAEAKLQGILSAAKEDYDDETYAQVSNTITDFVNSGDIQKSKLYNYCVDFVDPTRSATQTNSAVGQSVVNHKQFSESELVKLYDFIKTHAKDKTFGDVVFEMIRKRNIEPRDVYKRAKLSRQDFYRVVDEQCKNVTRQMVWSIIFGLRCTPTEAEYVLFSAGYRKRNDKFDLTLMFFLEHQNYDIMAINEVLYDFDLKLLSYHEPVKD